MTTEEATNIYKSLSQPPKGALREIQAGRLKGKTDINPQWRYEAMTEKFGLVGIGWRYEITRLWTEEGADKEVLAFAQVAVYVRTGDGWSEPITGIGGSTLVAAEKNGLRSNDEGYKMAVTDAFSTALKMLGVAADIYAGRWDGTKYREFLPSSAEREERRAFVPKGGEASPLERNQILGLLNSTYSDGSPVFSLEEKRAYSDSRSELTSVELISRIKGDLNVRLANRQASGDRGGSPLI